MSSSSSDSHRHRKKRKHRHRHRSYDDKLADTLKTIQKEMQSISSRVTSIETDRSTKVQSAPEAVAEQSSTSTTPAYRPAPREEQRASLAGDEAAIEQSSWVDRDVEEVPDYTEHIFWEPEPDSDNPDSDTLKLSQSTTKMLEDAFGHSIPNEKRRGLKRKLPVPDSPFTKAQS